MAFHNFCVYLWEITCVFPEHKLSLGDYLDEILQTLLGDNPIQLYTSVLVLVSIIKFQYHDGTRKVILKNLSFYL